MEKKTYEEHRQYLHDIVKLKLWFAWGWKKDHPYEPFQSALRHRVDIFRKTDLHPGTMKSKVDYDNQGWMNLEKQLCKHYENHSADGNADAFEKSAFQIVKPFIDARVRRDYEERPYVLDFQCGSLKYDPPSEENPARIFFHIANACVPRSIFYDRAHLPRCFIELMDACESKYGANTLETYSWLNSLPEWNRLFPDEWREHMEDEVHDVIRDYGFWGQFINGRETFNHQYGQQLRNTGKLPYYPRHSWCTFKALRHHLSKMRGFNGRC